MILCPRMTLKDSCVIIPVRSGSNNIQSSRFTQRLISWIAYFRITDNLYTYALLKCQAISSHSIYDVHATKREALSRCGMTNWDRAPLQDYMDRVTVSTRSTSTQCSHRRRHLATTTTPMMNVTLPYRT